MMGALCTQASLRTRTDGISLIPASALRACQTLATTGLTLFLLPEGGPPTPVPAWPRALGFPLNWTDCPESAFRVWLPTLLHLRCLVQSAWFEDFSRASASALVGRGDKYSLVGTSRQVTRGASFLPTETLSESPRLQAQTQSRH